MSKITKPLVATLKAHLAGRQVPVPEAGRLVWRWFLDLCHSRTGSGFGPNPITYAEIEAYARLNRWPMDSHHIEILKELDRAWLEHARAEIGKDTKTSKRPPVEAAPALSAAAFDAIFT